MERYDYCFCESSLHFFSNVSYGKMQLAICDGEFRYKGPGHKGSCVSFQTEFVFLSKQNLCCPQGLDRSLILVLYAHVGGINSLMVAA